MKQSIIILLIATVTMGCFAQKFDKRLTKKLGADEYGMKSYVLVILKTGETTISDKQQRDSIFAGHMKISDVWPMQACWQLNIFRGMLRLRCLCTTNITGEFKRKVFDI